MVATWFLPNSLEDLLALALAGAVGYASILNLPLRRREAKDRLEAVSTKFTKVHSSLLSRIRHPRSCLWHGLDGFALEPYTCVPYSLCNIAATSV